MRTRALRTLWACLLIVTFGCAESDDNALDAAPDSSTEPLSCDEREAHASAALSRAVDDADLRCSRPTDCEVVSIDTQCHAACGALVSVSGKADIEAAIAEQDATTCAGFEADGCMRVVPPCVPPGPFDCIEQRCTWTEGLPDASVPVDGGEACLEHTITLGSDGGLVASRRTFFLEPCRTFRAEDTALDEPPVEICNNEIPTNGDVTVEDINALVADADVRAAVADAPVLYGGDPRPIDGTVTRIEIDGAIIDVGRPCDAPCTAIPAGVAALADALEALVAQQRSVVPNCLGTD